jgi:hypothetical protein
LDSSSTNIARDQGVWKERRSIASTAGRSLYTSLLILVSFTPKLRVGSSQIDRLDGLQGRRIAGQQTDMPRRDAVCGLVARRHLGTRDFQLTSKS